MTLDMRHCATDCMIALKAVLLQRRDRQASVPPETLPPAHPWSDCRGPATSPAGSAKLKTGTVTLPSWATYASRIACQAGADPPFNFALWTVHLLAATIPHDDEVLLMLWCKQEASSKPTHSSAFLRNSQGPPAPCGVRCLFWALLSQVNGKVTGTAAAFSSVLSYIFDKLSLPEASATCTIRTGMLYIESPPFLSFVMGLETWSYSCLKACAWHRLFGAFVRLLRYWVIAETGIAESTEITCVPWCLRLMSMWCLADHLSTGIAAY